MIYLVYDHNHKLLFISTDFKNMVDKINTRFNNASYVEKWAEIEFSYYQYLDTFLLEDTNEA